MPSFSTVSVTISAQARTCGRALPIATPIPASCSISKSFSASPKAMVSSGVIPIAAHSRHGGADFCLLNLHAGVHAVGVHPVFFKKDAAAVLFLQKLLQGRQIHGGNGRFPHDLTLQLTELAVHINSTVNRDPGQHVFFRDFQRMAAGTQKYLHAAAL